MMNLPVLAMPMLIMSAECFCQRKCNVKCVTNLCKHFDVILEIICHITTACIAHVPSTDKL